MEPTEVPPERPRPLDPRVRTLWWLAAVLRAALVSVLTVSVDFLFLPEFGPAREFWSPGWLSSTVAIAAFGLAILVPPLRYRRWRYALRERELWLRRGILWVRISVIPYRRLQFVDTEQGPLERLFGLARVVAYTAAPGTSGWIPGLDQTFAEELRERLARLAPEHGDDA